MISSTNPLGFSAARRRTRRWIVAVYWAFMLSVSAVFVLHQPGRSLTFIPLLLIVQMFFHGSAILGGVRAGGLVKPFRGIRWAPLLNRNDVQTVFGPRKPIIAGTLADEADLDERESRDRDRIHFASYTLIRWFALLLLTVYMLLGSFRADLMVRVAPSFLILLTLTLWSLPQSLILWNEPDVEVPQ